MSDRQPAKKRGHLTVFPRPKDHVPMIGHQTIRQQPHWRATHGCDHNPFKRGIIVRLVKQFVSSVRAIEGVINYFPQGYTCSSRHGQRYAARLDPVRKKVRVPFIPLIVQREDKAATGLRNTYCMLRFFVEKLQRHRSMRCGSPRAQCRRQKSCLYNFFPFCSRKLCGL